MILKFPWCNSVNGPLTKVRMKYKVSELSRILFYLETDQKLPKKKIGLLTTSIYFYFFQHNLTSLIKCFKRGGNLLHVFIMGKNNFLSLPHIITLTELIPFILLSTPFRLFYFFMAFLESFICISIPKWFFFSHSLH